MLNLRKKTLIKKMAHSSFLNKTFELHPDEGAPLITVIAKPTGNRLDFCCRFIFNHVLGVRYLIKESKVESQAGEGFTISYTKDASDGLKIEPSGFLNKQGIIDTKPERSIHNSLLYFYRNNTGNTSEQFDFDIFSAVFYMISRMEEWQAFEPDVHKRFEAKESVLFKDNFHFLPVVDLWIMELKSALQKRYPDLEFPEKKFKVISTLDIDNLFAYKHKGFLRTLGALAKDLIKRDLKTLKERLSVLKGSQKDPFDVYEQVSSFCLSVNIPLFCFFLFRSGTKYDRTINPASPAYDVVLKTLKRYGANIGLHPSYEAAYKPGLLLKEIKKLGSKLGEKVYFSRQHFLRFDIKTTPKQLIENGIVADFTMGFASTPGFRAGTSFPFYNYDFYTESAGNLLMLPFCAMDGAYTVYNHSDASSALDSLLSLAKAVKYCNGYFITVFHERSFSEHLYKGYAALYYQLHKSLTEQHI
jgi:hypothetical protein